MACSKYELGFEHNRFETNVSQAFHCPICLLVLKDPVLCGNEHVFCKSCIKKHLENSSSCPKCRETLTVDTLKPASRTVKEYISELNIHCDFHPRGCPEIVQVANLERHVASCGFSPVKCSNDGCDAVVNTRDKLHHEAEVCDFRKLKCHDCADVKELLQLVLARQDQIKDEIKAEVKNQVKGMRGEIKVEVKREIQEVKNEIKAVKNETKNETKKIKDKLNVIKDDVSVLQFAVKDEMNKTRQETKIQVEIIKEETKVEVREGMKKTREEVKTEVKGLRENIEVEVKETKKVNSEMKAMKNEVKQETKDIKTGLNLLKGMQEETKGELKGAMNRICEKVSKEVKKN